MEMTFRLARRTLRALGVAAIAMAMAMGVSTQLNSTRADAADAASVWIQETNAPYGSVFFQTGVTGADCYMYNVLDAQGYYQGRRAVRVNPPAVKTGGLAADYIVWVRLFNGNTLVATDWVQSSGRVTLPANSGPWSVGSGIRIEDAGGFFGNSPIKAQVYVGMYYPNTNQLMDWRLLTVNQYSISLNTLGRTNAPSC